jgi:hypothetical protein
VLVCGSPSIVGKTMPDPVVDSNPVIPRANMTVGALRATYAWSQMTQNAAADGGDDALMLAQTLEKRSILTAAITPNFPLAWKVSLLGLAQLGFQKMPAFTKSEHATLHDLVESSLLLADTDQLSPRDKGGLEMVLTKHAITVSDTLPETRQVAANIKGAPDPANIYEQINDKLGGDPAARGGIYGTLVQTVDPAVKQDYDNRKKAQGPDDHDGPDHPDAPDHPDGGDPHPGGSSSSSGVA